MGRRPTSQSGRRAAGSRRSRPGAGGHELRAVRLVAGDVRGRVLRHVPGVPAPKAQVRQTCCAPEKIGCVPGSRVRVGDLRPVERRRASPLLTIGADVITHFSGSPFSKFESLNPPVNSLKRQVGFVAS